MNVIIHDIPRIYTGIAEWAACLMFVLLFPPRMRRQLQIPVSLGFLVFQCLFLEVTDDVSIFWWIPCMVVAFAMMVAQILVLSDLNLQSACYMGVYAFVLAEFAAALEWQLHYFLWGEQDPVWWQQYILLAAVYGLVYAAYGLIASRLMMPPGKMTVTRSELFIVVIIGILVFAMSNVSFYDRENLFSATYARDIMNIRTMVDFAGNAVLIAYFIQRKQHRSQKELAAMQTVLESQYAQYRLSRDTIDMINRRYHDLKHQIAALRAEPDAAVRERWLREMEEDIRAYEAQNKTGNNILDTVLTGKSLNCQKNGIELVAVADGKVLEFMDVMDICTIFGNALDNAIECELKIPDPSRRVIRLMLSAQKRFLLLKVENYCPTPPDFRDGLPATTKRDRDSHGFGLKSIRNAAQKYGGSMTTAVEDGWFVLKVLIPLKDRN